MAGDNQEDVPLLELEAIIGYNGYVPSGLICHPDREHLVYPLGCTVIIQNLNTNKQRFLRGHTNNVSCVAVAKSGKYIASGQVTYMGFKADIILWDYAKMELYANFKLHKVKIESLAFSPNGLYLVSLGGQDDGSVVVWNVTTREAICGSPASSINVGHAHSVIFSNTSDEVFMTAGNGTLRIWELDVTNRKILPEECRTGQLKRLITCIATTEDDQVFYCGTTTGDVLMINMTSRKLITYGPPKDKFSMGVMAVAVLKNGDLVIGSGEGKLALCRGPNFKAVKILKLQGSVNSITLRGQGHQFFVGTGESQIYRLNYPEFKEELITTCHSEAVNDIVFPFGTAELFGTCAKSDIRVWHNPSNKELLRISIPNMTCQALSFMRDGKSIVSGWDDGRIRAFMPESGRQIYAIENAHSIGVTAIGTTSNCKRIISGGGEGQLRIWEIGKQSQKLLESMKEHKAAVSCIRVKSNDLECVTASCDGTCIIWDLVRFVRSQMILANTLFRCVCYHPEEFQIITSGSDRKIGYWEVFDGSPIRELEGSMSGSINAMDISLDANYFVSGGDDKLIKVWHYNNGEVTHVGIGHSGNITCLRICPFSKHIISVSADGAIIRWKYPYPC